MTTTTTTVVTVAAEDTLRLLEMERCTWRMDAKGGRRQPTRPTRPAQAEAARRHSVCRRVSERKDLGATHESKMQRARAHLGRRV